MNNSQSSQNRLQREIEQLVELPTSVLEAIKMDALLENIADEIAIIRRGAGYAAQLEILQGITRSLVEARNLDLLARLILEGAQQIIPFTDGAIGIVSEGIITFPYAIGENALEVMKYHLPVGQGLTGWAVENRTAVRVGDMSEDRRYERKFGHTVSEMDVPIIYDGESIGVINVEGSAKDAFSEDHQRFLEALAEHAAIAIRNAQLFDQINFLTIIAKQVTSSLDLDHVLEKILVAVSQLIKSPEVSIGILDHKTSLMKFTHAIGPSRAEVLTFEQKSDEGLTGWVLQNRESVRVDDVTTDSRYTAYIGATRSQLVAPIMFGDHLIGVLNAESPYVNAFSEQDEQMMSAFASFAAIAITNAQSYEQIKRELESAQARHIAAETMAAIGDIAGNLVHRMNNDIGAIRVRAKQISSLSEDETIRDKATRIEALAETALKQVRDFRERYKDVEPGPVGLNDLIRSCLDQVAIPEGITVVENLADVSTVFGAEEHLKEVFRNLIANAVEAMPNGGMLQISSQLSLDKIVVRVKDTGKGIAADQHSRIFNRGFSTKPEGQGLGYGLWWVHVYLSRIGGEVILEESRPGSGSTFAVLLPLHKT